MLLGIVRIEQKITQEKLALLCNIDRSYVGRIERGRSKYHGTKARLRLHKYLKLHHMICCLKTNEASSFTIIFIIIYLEDE